ncbi:MAG: ankyrin repeat domain-containing protein [Puniceicoccales bacterium]|jgi:ankyrin repeat protein|nr:ankyrin repeat domain-containing protein [Puniceicoccales bacterium]
MVINKNIIKTIVTGSFLYGSLSTMMVNTYLWAGATHVENEHKDVVYDAQATKNLRKLLNAASKGGHFTDELFRQALECLKEGANPNIRDGYKSTRYTLLHWAFYEAINDMYWFNPKLPIPNAAYETATALLKRSDVNLNIVDAAKKPPLFWLLEDNEVINNPTGEMGRNIIEMTIKNALESVLNVTLEKYFECSLDSLGFAFDKIVDCGAIRNAINEAVSKNDGEIIFKAICATLKDAIIKIVKEEDKVKIQQVNTKQVIDYAIGRAKADDRCDFHLETKDVRSIDKIIKDKLVTIYYRAKEALILQLLSREDIKLDITDEDGNTALHHFMSSSIIGNAGLKELLDKEEKWHACSANNNFEIPIHLAAQNKTSLYDFRSCLTELWWHKKNVEKELFLTYGDVNGDTIFHHMARGGYVGAMEFLLERFFGFFWNQSRESKIEKLMQKNKEGKTILHCAMASENRNIMALIKVLFNAFQRELNFQDPSLLLFRQFDNDGNTPLHDAAAHGHWNVIEHFYSQDENRKRFIGLKNRQGETMIHLAAENGHMNVVSKLLDLIMTIDPKSRVKTFRLVLNKKTTDQKLASCSILLGCNQKGCDAYNYGCVVEEKDHPIASRWKDDSGATLLHYVARDDNAEAIKALLNLQLKLGNSSIPAFLDRDKNAQDNQGLTPLHYAAINDSVNVTKILLETPNVDRGAQDEQGLTPLHHAAKNGAVNVAKILLETSDVKKDAKDKEGYTPLDWAEWQLEPEQLNNIEDEDERADMKAKLEQTVKLLS